jgi:hypothetical protein
MTTDDTEGPEIPLSARESLDLIDRQEAEMDRDFSTFLVRLYATWAVLWFVAFAALHAAGNGRFSFGVAVVIMGVAVLVGAVVSTVLGVRSGRGRRGPSMVGGALYGWTWLFGFAALVVVNLSIMGDLPRDVVPVLWTGSVMVLAGVLFMTGGAMFRDVGQYVLGGWLLLVGVACVLVDVDYQALVIAFGGLIGLGVRAVFARRGSRVAR